MWRPRGSLPVSEGCYREVREGHLVRNCSIGQRAMGANEKWRHLDKQFLTVQVGRHWNRFLRKVVDAAALEVFKARLEKALSSMVWWEVPLPMAGVLGLGDL